MPFDIVLKRPRSDGQVSSRDDLFALLLDVFVRHQVTGNLFADESIQRFVGIERPNDVVPITPRITDQDIPLNVGEVCVTRQIEPVSSPVISEPGRFEQPIDDLFKSVIGRVVRKRFDFFMCWWQSSEINRDTAQQRVTIRVISRSEPRFLESSQNESIKIILWPLCILHLRDSRFSDWLQSPELFRIDLRCL